MILGLEIFLITVVLSVGCSLPGNFLVLRGQSLSTFALSHSILFGIVLMFLITGSLHPAVLMFGAAATGLLIFWLVGTISRTKHVNNDAALGIVYMFIFSLGVILIARYASNLAINPTAIVTGNLALVVFERLTIDGKDFGPSQLWISLIILLANVSYILFMYKELKITSFDLEFAKIIGLDTTIINVSFMSLVSLTVVSAYRVAGVIMVVAIMIIPPATSFLLSKSLKKMILLSTLIAFVTSSLGFLIAWVLGGVEVASVIAVLNGFTFLGVLLFSKRSRPVIVPVGNGGSINE